MIICKQPASANQESRAATTVGAHHPRDGMRPLRTELQKTNRHQRALGANDFLEVIGGLWRLPIEVRPLNRRRVPAHEREQDLMIGIISKRTIQNGTRPVPLPF